MDAFLWALAVLLAAVFLVAGIPKLTRSKAELVSGQPWARDFPDSAIKAVGVAEVLAAVGLVAPALVGVLPGLVPVAASGVVLLELGAAVVHARQGRGALVALNLALAGMALFLATQRFGPYAF